MTKRQSLFFELVRLREEFFYLFSNGIIISISGRATLGIIYTDDLSMNRTITINFDLGRQVFQLPGLTRRDLALTPSDELRHMLLRIRETWDPYTAFFHNPIIPWTKYLIEQAIGRMKMCGSTMRGFSATSWMLNGLLVSATNLI